MVGSDGGGSFGVELTVGGAVEVEGAGAGVGVGTGEEVPPARALF